MTTDPTSSDSPAQDPTPPDVAPDLATPPARRSVGTPRVMRTHDPEGDARKVAVLTGALPWLREFHGRIVVVKYGGHAMVDEQCRRAFAEDMVFLRTCGILPVVVHGGGPQINGMLSRLGIESEFRGGLRVTTEETIDVVRMVLTGQVGPEVVGLINSYGPLAVGLSGEDGGLFTAERTHAIIAGEPVDVGLVGDVVAVDPAPVHALLEAGHIPVVATVAPDAHGQVHNVNADTAAAALAVALGAVKLVVLTDVEGLYANWPDRDSLVQKIDATELAEILPTLDAGMIPKMAACLRAVEGGVRRATVIDGRLPHALLLETFTTEGTGTMVVPAGTDTTAPTPEGVTAP
ncbi:MULTISPECIES: acetylglutamate kinase [unclassified Modestobacter]|uniref:acetylglutamate kinase n=1 Tax=unclassified Modestobacter TaxID=2643866 RepID=UPI0022AA410B|nr:MULTISPECIES: acetylglutamate kinase [unclassified Modestobacter]MCZ2812714.1 acetylglutamate kinase [Modestobacter sp. VKM Ac-2979]MCZ2843257.1 acetylglutamate kinase [Modestobacter sp. VKM Ac-2980]MCZ2850950.1 acetylglutamate kinase [Modestobacter sp. VKM Ac-2978]